MAHFEFVPGDEKVIAPGRTVKRIRALVAIAALGITPGTVGGYVEKPENLSGDAWVCGNAQVSGNARVHGNAQVRGNAQVSGNARVHGNAWVCGNAQVYGDARVHGNAQVRGNAQVSGNAQVCGNAQVSGDAQVESRLDNLQIGPAKSSGRFTTAHKDKKIGVRVNCGCFSGSVLEFSQQIEKTHCDNPEALQQYRLFCQLIAFNFGVEE